MTRFAPPSPRDITRARSFANDAAHNLSIVLAFDGDDVRSETRRDVALEEAEHLLTEALKLVQKLRQPEPPKSGDAFAMACGIVGARWPEVTL
ncbi:MAG TPA: hypothetical protein VGN74_05455 [Brevundimonas sp.]|jgi:hypothetical protein|uniref:hypothetical protein n=1 Tax=Brevundimonas sp. TaxID=1871086 RepID=UPI002E0D5496|nr:hypothetical protein [Brevundimonas sp.]